MGHNLKRIDKKRSNAGHISNGVEEAKKHGGLPQLRTMVDKAVAIAQVKMVQYSAVSEKLRELESVAELL
jgi:hypothetical protein